MVDRPPYPIPAEVHPEKYRCIVVPVPDEPTYVRVFAGVISDMTQWFNWARDEGKNGKECAQVWRDIYNEIDWSGNMGKCGCNCIPQRFRFTADGGYQVSNDGGITWVDAPEYDYRNTSTLSPPLVDQGIVSSKCQSADSVVATYRDQIIQNMNDTDTASAILALVAAALLIFLTAGTGLIVAGIVGLGGAIVGFGVSATQSAFTESVWEEFRCLVYCRMNSDDSIDEIGYKQLIQDVHDSFEGIVNIVLTNLLNATGTVGLTNIMRSNAGDPDADCTGCSCGDCDEYDFTTSEYDWEIYTIGGTPYGEYIPGTGFRARWFNDAGFSYQMNGVIQKAWTGEGIGIVRVTTNFVSSNPTAEVTVTVEGVNFTETSIPAGLHTTTFNIDTGAVDDIKVTTVFYPSPTGTDYVDVVSVEICPPEV